MAVSPKKRAKQSDESEEEYSGSESDNESEEEIDDRREIMLPDQVSGLEFPYLWFSDGNVRGFRPNTSPIEFRLSARIFADFANVHLQQLTDCLVVFNIPRSMDETDIYEMCLTNTEASEGESSSVFGSPLSGVDIKEIILIRQSFARAFIRVGSAQQASLIVQNLDTAKLTLTQDGVNVMAKQTNQHSSDKNDDNTGEEEEYPELCELTATLIQFEPKVIEVERTFNQFRESVETVNKMHWKQHNDLEYDRCVADGKDPKQMQKEQYHQREERRKRRKTEQSGQIYLANGTLVSGSKTLIDTATKKHSIKRKIIDRVTPETES